MLTYADQDMDQKLVLYISPLPPPCGGIATWTEMILKNGINHFQAAVIDTKIQGQRNIFEPASFELSEFKRFFSILANVCQQLIFKRPAIVHLSCSLSSVGIFRDFIIAAIVKCFRIPLITHYHGNLPDFNKRKFFGLSGVIIHLLIKISSLNIVENKFSYDADIIKHIQKNKLLYLPNFVDDALFNHIQPKKQSNERTQAIFVGGITRTKGALELIDIARALPDIDFNIFGKLQIDMKAHYQGLPHNMILHGTVPHQTLLTVMQQHDFLIFPTYTEGFPLTVVEAMAMGLPVISTPVGAIPEMIDEGLGGYLIAPGDAQGMIAAVKRLLAKRNFKETFGQYNQQKAFNHFRFSTVSKDINIIYQQLIGADPCAG